MLSCLATPMTQNLILWYIFMKIESFIELHADFKKCLFFLIKTNHLILLSDLKLNILLFILPATKLWSV